MGTAAGTLVLFDVDGTLLQGAHQTHWEALRAAVAEVHGVREEKLPRVEAAGRTDGAIVRDVLLLCGVSAERIDDRADEVREAAWREYARRCAPDLSDHVAAGVSALLEGLAARDGVRLALVTGNYEPIARLKLERAGLGHWFARGQGAFGSDSEDRAALPPIARRRAGADGRPFPRAHTVVVGDTPRDIACARADRLRSVAVATGPYRREDLRGADAVAADAYELADILARLP